MVTVKRRLLGRVAVTAVQRPRRAITLVEILVSVVIVSLLAAAVIPTVYSRIRAARADVIIAEMRSLQNGIMLFRRDVGRYPLRLTYLKDIADGDYDLCSVEIPEQNLARWRGPYVDRQMPLEDPSTKYLLSTGDSVEVVLTYSALSGSPRVIQISVHGTADVSHEVDLRVDGISGNNVGTVQYSGQIMTWSMAIRGGAC